MVKGCIVKRTPKQNNSIHLYCDHLSSALNAADYDRWYVSQILLQGINAPWTMDSVKYGIFHEIMKSLYPQKTSTTQLSTKECTFVYDNVNKFLIDHCERLPYIPWPSLDEQYNKAIGR